MASGFALNRSRQVAAEETPAFGAIAERFRRGGDLERAITLCREGLERFPLQLSARVTLGWCLLDLGRYDEARAELEQVLRRAPDNLAAIRGLAELHDRAENSVIMDGPGAWPPDAESVDATSVLDELGRDPAVQAGVAPVHESHEATVQSDVSVGTVPDAAFSRATAVTEDDDVLALLDESERLGEAAAGEERVEQVEEGEAATTLVELVTPAAAAMSAADSGGSEVVVEATASPADADASEPVPATDGDGEVVEFSLSDALNLDETVSQLAASAGEPEPEPVVELDESAGADIDEVFHALEADQSESEPYEVAADDDVVDLADADAAGEQVPEFALEAAAPASQAAADENSAANDGDEAPDVAPHVDAVAIGDGVAAMVAPEPDQTSPAAPIEEDRIETPAQPEFEQHLGTAGSRSEWVPPTLSPLLLAPQPAEAADGADLSAMAAAQFAAEAFAAELRAAAPVVLRPRARATIVRLERFLRKVEARRRRLAQESVA
jgi:Tetratricopeptide repeat